MTMKQLPVVKLAVLAMAAIWISAAPGVAQPTNTPGMGACPDDGKNGGVVAMTPLGGGGCESTVFATGSPDSPPNPLSSKRGAKPKTTAPSTAPSTTPIAATKPKSLPMAMAKKKADGNESKPAAKPPRTGEKLRVQKERVQKE